MQILSPLQKKLLEKRGVKEEEIERFISPDFSLHTYDPFLLPDMEKAVLRILEGVQRNEKIIIYADYDCDGIPGAVLTSDFFKKIKYKNFQVYIPHRHKEGYGLNKNAITKFKEEGYTLLITIDLAITNVEEVSYAQSLGIDCIITDHHLPHTEEVGGKSIQIIPSAYAVINAKRDDNKYPDTMLCGAATAWKLVCALLTQGKKMSLPEFLAIPAGWEKWLLDMVGISTVADMVPLRDENRVLAHYGLLVLRKSPRVGLQALLKRAGVVQKNLTEEDIGFSIAPRINAASRMDDPIQAFLLLSADTLKDAEEKSLFLENLNSKRKESVSSIMKKAYSLAEPRKELPLIVVGDLDWSPGVLGLIASKIGEKYGKSVFVWGKGEESELIKGSCRSDGFVHLVDLMYHSKDVLEHMGGHELAGGFSLTHKNILNLEDSLLRGYEKVRHTPLSPKEKEEVSGELSLEDVHLHTYKEIALLAPFGVSNEKPFFSFRNVLIESVKNFGKEKNHLEIVFKSAGGKKVKSIGFFMTKEAIEEKIKRTLSSGEEITLLGYIEYSHFAGKSEVRLRIYDILS